MAFAAKVHELISFLVDVRGVKAVDVELKARATYHDSCSGLRELGIREQPRRLLRSVKGLELVELADAEVCCGFGGTFSVKYPDISNAIVERKAEQIAATGADMLLAGDLGCLMNMAGKLSRQGRNVAVRHVAEVLAGELDRSGDLRAPITPMQSTSPAFKDNARAALGDVQLQRALASVAPGLAARRGAARAGLPEFEALRDRRPRHQGPHAGASRPLPGGVREKGHRSRQPSCISPRRRRMRGRSSARSAATRARASSPRANR